MKIILDRSFDLCIMRINRTFQDTVLKKPWPVMRGLGLFF
jgi:hypothetical protein